MLVDVIIQHMDAIPPVVLGHTQVQESGHDPARMMRMAAPTT